MAITHDVWPLYFFPLGYSKIKGNKYWKDDDGVVDLNTLVQIFFPQIKARAP